MIDKGVWDEVFIWDPSNCDCNCDKSCDVGEYLDCKKFKCRNKFVDKLVEEYSESIDENELIYNGTLNDYKNVCNSCAIYFILTLVVHLFSLVFKKKLYWNNNLLDK